MKAHLKKIFCLYIKLTLHPVNKFQAQMSLILTILTHKSARSTETVTNLRKNITGELVDFVVHCGENIQAKQNSYIQQLVEHERVEKRRLKIQKNRLSWFSCCLSR